MPTPNSTPDTESNARTRDEVRRLTDARPSWWKRATSYAVRRLADTASGSGRNRTQTGEGRGLLAERRLLRV